MDSGELYQKKYQYEKLIKNLDDCLGKLDDCYSNLLLCRKKISNCIKIDNNYYSCTEYENIIKVVNNNRYKIRNNILPQARYQYNKILSEIANL